PALPREAHAVVLAEAEGRHSDVVQGDALHGHRALDVVLNERGPAGVPITLVGCGVRGEPPRELQVERSRQVELQLGSEPAADPLVTGSRAVSRPVAPDLLLGLDPRLDQLLGELLAIGHYGFAGLGGPVQLCFTGSAIFKSPSSRFTSVLREPNRL